MELLELHYLTENSNYMQPKFKKLDYIINEEHVSQISINNSEIFDVEAFFSAEAAISKISRRD